MSDLKLALFGQIYDSEGLLYSYPEKIMQLRASGQYPAWINALQSDSRFLRELVNPGGECFSVRYGQEGLFYSYTKFNPHDSRNGVVSIVLYTKDKAVSDAKQLMNVLQNLMDYFLEKNSAIGIMDADVESLLKDLSDPYMIGLPSPAEASPSQDAYRVFQTEEELQKYLYCAIQKEYTRFKWVHFISASNRKTVINPTLYLELNSRVAECFVIKRTDGYELASSGTNCSFTFTKEGYLPQKVNFTVGQSSPYITVDANNMIHVRPMNELHLTFKKRIKILLFDESTNMPIVEDGIQVSFTEELIENTPKRIVLSAKGYQRKTITLDPSKMTTAEGSLRQTLQRDVQDFNPNQDNQSYGLGEDEQQDKSLSMNKNILIICLIAAFVIGAGIGFAVPTFVISEKSNTNRELDSIMNVNKLYVDSIIKLKKDTIVLNKIIRQKDEEILKNNKKENPKGNIDESKKRIEAANKKALLYLNSNREWSLSGMTKASGDPQYIASTESYKFLQNLVLAQNLNAVVDFQGITNTIWKDSIAPLIQTYHSKKANDVKRHINSANKKTNEPLNGELKLLDLFNNLNEI